MSQLQQHSTNTQLAIADDEIDLRDLLKKIWATRIAVIKALFIVLSFYVIFVGAKFFLLTEKTVRYSQIYDLTFEGLSKGKFPNGSHFVLSDITSPTVLNRVYQQNNLEAQSINLTDFRNGVNVQPYARNIEFIRAKYESRLADKKLDPIAINDLQKRMENEIKAAQSSSIEVSLTLTRPNNIDAVLATKVIADIVNTWAERAIVEQGVLKANVAVYSDRIFSNERFENLDYLLGMELLLNSIKLVRNNIASLREQPNANTLVDDQSGFTLVDLDKAMQDIASYDIRQIIDPIKELGISRNPEIVKLYFERRLVDLQEEQKQWKARAEATRAILNGEIRVDQNATSSTITSSNNMVPQLGDAFLDRLLEVSRQGSNLEFRQNLTKEVLKYQNRSIDLQQEITEIQRTLKGLNGKDKDSNIRLTYVKAVQEQLPVVLENLREYTRVMNRMYEKQGKQNAGYISQLITAQGGTFNIQATRIVTGQDLKILALLLVMTVFIVGFAAMVRQTLKEDK
ncbi:MAG: hypothetical protein WAO12_10170 [Venatoribacter sp.]